MGPCAGDLGSVGKAAAVGAQRVTQPSTHWVARHAGIPPPSPAVGSNTTVQRPPSADSAR